MSTKNTRKRINPLSRLSHNKRGRVIDVDLDDSDSDSGSGSGARSGSDSALGPWSGTGDADFATDPISGRRTPRSKDGRSYLVNETKKMERQRREFEQEAERRLGRVQVREHDDVPQETPEGELQNDILQHPWLETQRFDGIDPSVNPVPPLNSEARTEYENALRLQHQLRMEKNLENTPQQSTAPRPQRG